MGDADRKLWLRERIGLLVSLFAVVVSGLCWVVAVGAREQVGQQDELTVSRFDALKAEVEDLRQRCVDVSRTQRMSSAEGAAAESVGSANNSGARELESKAILELDARVSAMEEALRELMARLDTSGAVKGEDMGEREMAELAAMVVNLKRQFVDATLGDQVRIDSFELLRQLPVDVSAIDERLCTDALEFATQLSDRGARSRMYDLVAGSRCSGSSILAAVVKGLSVERDEESARDLVRVLRHGKDSEEYVLALTEIANSAELSAVRREAAVLLGRSERGGR